MDLEAEQKIYLIGETTVCHAGLSDFFKDEFGGWSDDNGRPYWETDALGLSAGAEAITELGGRICYNALYKNQWRTDNKSYIDNILSSKHGSVLQHVNWTFLFTGISRSLMAELTRHSAGVGFSIASQRYIDESNCKFVRPPQIKPGTEAWLFWAQGCENARVRYDRLYKMLTEEIEESQPEKSKRNKRILARQAARSVLPNCTETKIVMTANARALRWIIESRGNAGAEIEIRTLAVNLAKLMKKRHPNLFGDFEIDEENFTVTTEYEKV